MNDTARGEPCVTQAQWCHWQSCCQKTHNAHTHELKPIYRCRRSLDKSSTAATARTQPKSVSKDGRNILYTNTWAKPSLHPRRRRRRISASSVQSSETESQLLNLLTYKADHRSDVASCRVSRSLPAFSPALAGWLAFTVPIADNAGRLSSSRLWKHE